MSEKELTEIVNIITEIENRLLKFYEQSIIAYFNFLEVYNESSNKNRESSIVTATLRILRLLVKYGIYLEKVN